MDILWLIYEVLIGSAEMYPIFKDLETIARRVSKSHDRVEKFQ